MLKVGRLLNENTKSVHSNSNTLYLKIYSQEAEFFGLKLPSDKYTIHIPIYFIVVTFSNVSSYT